MHRNATWKGLGVLYVAGLPCENENSQASSVCVCDKHCRGSLEEQKLLLVSTGFRFGLGLKRIFYVLCEAEPGSRE